MSGVDLNNSIVKGLLSVIEDNDYNQQQTREEGYLSQSLSTGLCVINKRLQSHPHTKPQILVLQISPDVSKAYNSIMNCIFSAQKIGVPVDSLLFSSADSPFLQQASFLTGGKYQKPDNQSDSLQLLLMNCLPNAQLRQILKAPIPDEVDFSASCFCHGKQIEFAYMCSVCLALTCSLPSLCETCGTPSRASVETRS